MPPHGPSSNPTQAPAKFLRQSFLLPTLLNITLCRPRPSCKGPRTQTLFSAWNIRYSRGQKRPPRYTYRCDLAPQIEPIRQTILGYHTTPHRALPTCSRLRTQFSSHCKRAPTRLQRRRVSEGHRAGGPSDHAAHI